MARIDEVRKLLQRDPSDVFLNYSLALELVAAGDPGSALAQFDRTIELDAQYLAAYVKKAELLTADGQLDEARDTLHAGARIAESSGDDHMLDMIRENLAMLE